jgi:glycosyltransferase involved in cell wall biosynthesis
MKQINIAIVGTVGIPARYGGFETLAENLALYCKSHQSQYSLVVYCSSLSYKKKYLNYQSANLKYIPVKANGIFSVPYDIVSLFSAIFNKSDVILLLGVSGAAALPFVKLLSSVKIITNIDGIEWKRGKWHGIAKHFLRFSEMMAIQFSDEVISDNAAIAEYVRRHYGLKTKVIAYGGDHALVGEEIVFENCLLPRKYALSICRIEEENNIHIILEAFSKLGDHTIVIVGNWKNNKYGRNLVDRFGSRNNIFLLDPIYDLRKLKYLRSRALFYVHGHSAGGTNPSLVEAMSFGKTILAFDCNYNRSTTENKALYFSDCDELMYIIKYLNVNIMKKVEKNMMNIAKRRYTWNVVAKQYFSLFKV